MLKDRVQYSYTTLNPTPEEYKKYAGFSLVEIIKSTQWKISLSNWNKKVACLQLNMPPCITCPGRTPMCEKLGYCTKLLRYAKNRKWFFPNFETSKDKKTFLSLMVKGIEKYQRAGGKWFRFHSYGDFYNQPYLNSCIDIVRLFPKMKFVAHTKSFHLNYSHIPDNLSILFSIMPDHLKLPKTDFPFAFCGKPSEYKEKWQKQVSEAKTCPAACIDCRECWNPKSDVRFNWH